MARNQKAEAPQTQRVRYSAAGPIEELRGTAWEVPVTVANKAAWIESQYREQRARAAAAAEQELRQQQVLSDRISQQRSGEVQALQMAEANAAEAASLRAQVMELQQQLAMPDASRFAEIANGTTQAMARTFDLQQQVTALSAAVEDLALRTQEMAEGCAVQADANTALLKGQQELLNGSFGSYAAALQRGEDRLNDQQVQISELATKVADNWEAVDRAARINETATAQARQAAVELVTDQLDQFRVFLSVALQALGVTESDFSSALNRMDQGLQPGAFLISQNYIRQVVAIAQDYQAAKDDAERRTNIAASLAPR